MEDFRCPPGALPINFYRIQYPGSQTAHSGEGLTAKDVNVTYSKDEMDAFCQLIIQQLTWSHRGAQPYITCFSDKEHAENWALKEPWNRGKRGEDSWELLTIDTRFMPDTYKFCLNDLVTSLDLATPEEASQHVKGAYLCLHRIPTAAIINLASPREVEDEVEDRKWRETNDHWLDDYSGSEREAVENNVNDNIMRMIEGDWD